MKISNTIKITKLLTILFVSALIFSACTNDNDDDHDDHDHEEELITTITYTLSDGNDVVTLTYLDIDGEGGNDGTYTVSGPLNANSAYVGEIKLLNETESPAENITEEVEAEGDEHEFFYTNTAGLTIEKTDTDGTNPLGIETRVSTGSASSGTLTIILKHEPTKPNDGSASGAGGSTDVEVTFEVTVQ